MAEADVFIPVGVEPNLGSIKQAGEQIGAELTKSMDRSTKDAGEGFVKNIDNAIKAFQKFEATSRKLTSVTLVPSDEFAELQKNFDVAEYKFKEYARAYQDMLATTEEQRRQHRKRTFSNEDLETARASMEKYLALSNEYREKIESFDLTKKFNFSQQTEANKAIIEKMNMALYATQSYINKASQEEDKFIQKQAEAEEKAQRQLELEKEKARLQAIKDQAKEDADAEKYYKHIEALEAYINKANAADATTKDVETAIAKLTARYEELARIMSRASFDNNPHDTRLIMEYQAIGEALNQLKTRYEEVSVAEQEAKKQKVIDDNFADARKKVDDFTESLKRLLKQIFRLSKSAISKGIGALKDSLTGARKESESTSRELARTLKTLIKYGFGVRSIYFLYRKLRTAIAKALEIMREANVGDVSTNLNKLAASLQTLRNSWAAAFAPIINFVTPALLTLMNVLSSVANAIAAFFATLTGQATVVKAVTTSVGGLGKSLGGAGKAAKDAKGKLADFDKLNIIGNDKDSGGGGGGGGGSGKDDGSRFITETIKGDLYDLIKADKWFEIGQLFADKLNVLTQAADDWINNTFTPWGERWAHNLGNLLNGFIYHYNWELLGTTIADGINGVFSAGNMWYKTVHWEWFGKRVGDGIIQGLEDLDTELIGNTLANKLNKGIDFFYGLVRSIFDNRASTVGSTIADGFNNFFLNIHWGNLFETIRIGFNGVVESFKTFVEQFRWEDVGNAISSAFNESVRKINAKDAGQALSDFINNALDMLLKLDLVTFGEKIGIFLSSIDWVGIITKTLHVIWDVLIGLISGVFNGEYGTTIATIIATALGAKLAAEFAKIKIAQLLASATIKDALVSAGLAGTAATGAGAGTAGAAGAGGASLLGGLSASSFAVIGAALAGYVALWKIAADNQRDYNQATEERYGLEEQEKEHIATIQQLTDDLQGYHDASMRQMEVYDLEDSKIREIAEAYDELIDSNGKVKKGMQQRADAYISQLASAMGLEEEQVKKLIGKNGKLKDSIDKIIDSKKTDRAVSAYLDEYNHALSNVKKAEDNATKARKDNEAAIARQRDTQKEYDKAYQDYLDHVGQGERIEQEYLVRLQKASDANNVAKDAVDKTGKAVQDAEEDIININATMKNYEGYLSAVASGETDKIKEALQRMELGFIDAETGTKETLRKQVVNMEQYYQDLVERQKAGDKTVTDEMVADAQHWVSAAHHELEKLSDTGEAAMDNLKGGFDRKKKVISDTLNEIARTAKKSLDGVLDGVNLGTPKAKMPVYDYQVSAGTISPKLVKTVKLARGAVIPPNKEFLAVLGDQKRGTNVEAPLSTIQDAVRAVINERGVSSNISSEMIQLLKELITVVDTKQISISEREIGTAAISVINREKKRTGVSPILE